MIHRLIVPIVALVVVGASVARAQGDARLDLFPPDLRTQIQAIVDSTHQAGLPTETLVDRALEGRTKRWPVSVLLSAVRRESAKLARAKNVLGRATPAEIAAAAAVLDAGADPSTLEAMRRRRPQGSLATPLHLLENFLLGRVPKDTAAAVILRLTESSLDDAQMGEYWNIVQRDIAIGILPAAAASARAETFTAQDGALNTPPRNAPPTGTAPPPPGPVPPRRP